MKKLLTLSLGALIALPAVARDFTYTYEGNTVTYTVIDENAKTCKTKEGVKEEYANGPMFLESGNKVTNSYLKLPEHPMDGSTKFTLTEIGDCSFGECDINFIDLPNSITKIGDLAFTGCRFESLAIPSSVTQIGRMAFSQCQNLEVVGIPNSVTQIAMGAFEDCIRLMIIEIQGSGLTHIGDHAFTGCGAFLIEEGIDFLSLEISLPKSVTHIGNYAFAWSALREIVLPDNVETIGEGSFQKCSKLESLTVPQNIKNGGLGQKIWSDCPNIKDVYYMTTSVYPGPANAATNIFDEDVYNTATLHVAKGMVATFMNVNPWKLFGKIVDGTSGVTEIDADLESAQPGEIYNLYGVKVGTDANALAPGLYIVRTGDSVKKIAVK